MSAGTGIRHSEFNPSKTEPVHLLQIWLLPERGGLRPEYEERQFPEKEKRGRLRLIASPDGREGSLAIHQDVDLFAAILGPGEQVRHRLRPGRHAWIQVAAGSCTSNGQSLAAGDGVAVSDETLLELIGKEDAELLLFDLA